MWRAAVSAKQPVKIVQDQDGDDDWDTDPDFIVSDPFQYHNCALFTTGDRLLIRRQCSF